MNYIINQHPNPNAATKEQCKLNYNEEDILLQIFINEDLIPPPSTRIALQNERDALKAVIDGVPT
jgi:hypothetical protein